MTFTLNLDATLTLICIALQLMTLWFCIRQRGSEPDIVRGQPKPKQRFVMPNLFSSNTPKIKPAMISEEFAAEIEEANERERYT